MVKLPEKKLTILPNETVGNTVILRLVEQSDAEYIWKLRTDSRYNTHLSPVSGTPDDQRRWIEGYKKKESSGRDYYFIILRRDDRTPCGTIRIYDIENESFTWGSWILDENKPAKAALDSALQIYSIAFDVLKLKKSVFDVRKDNARTLAFHDRFGAIRTGETESDILFELPKSLFVGIRDRFLTYFR